MRSPSRRLVVVPAPRERRLELPPLRREAELPLCEPQWAALERREQQLRDENDILRIVVAALAVLSLLACMGWGGWL